MCFGDHKDDKGDKSSEEKICAAKEKIAGKAQRTTAVAGQNAKRLLGRVSGIIENSSAIKQLAVGAASGW